MKVQVYHDGYPRVFAPGEHYMVCELNAVGPDEAEDAMRKMGWRRAKPWASTDWGYETTFRRLRTSQGKEK